ncbi:MAG: S8 family serine peptidase [Solirubrobacterales bacterium]
MTRAGELPVRRALLGLLLALLALAPAAAARDSRGDSILSPRLGELARPSIRSASEARQASAVGLPPEGPGSLQRQGRRVLVAVRFDGGIGTHLDELRAAGAQVLEVSHRYQTATVAVKPGGLQALNGVAGVRAASEVLAPTSAAVPCAGSVVSEGDAQLGAASARTDFGVDGSGVTVGILSDSFAVAEGTATTAAGDVLSGDLPGSANPCGNTTPVGILADSKEPEEATDEGRAMAQIVHDLAPGAAIDFATADDGEEAFANNIRALAAAGASVIVDDVAYFEEPFFQDGPVAVAIEEVVAKGVNYLTAAGNDNLENEAGDEIASWETPEFRDSGSCPPKLEATAAKPDQCLDFNPGPGTDETFGITIEPKETLIADVQWAEPWFGVKADLDAYLLNSAGEPIVVEEGSSDSIARGKPVEIVSWENKTKSPEEVQLVIDRCFSSEAQAKEKKGCNYKADPTAMPPVKVLLAENGLGVSETEYPKSSPPDVVGPTIDGHSAANGAISVGAVPFNDSSQAEPYSSRGPAAHYFGPVTGSTPAPLLAGAPQTLAKPDIAATDCGRTTFFFPNPKTPDTFRFCGTSAAAPHAAAVVALARQANPSATPAQILAGLTATARPVAPGPRAGGAGLIDAYGAINEIALPPKISFLELPAVTKDPTPSISFTANRPVVFSCSLDGGPLRPCASPFTPEDALPDGPHRLLVRGVDLSGRSGQGETSFTVDTVPPRAFFVAHPRKNLRTRARRVRAVFGFGSDEAGARFICRIDGGLSHFCPAILAHRFGAGTHVVRVKAVDAAGNVDPTEAVYRFRVRRVGAR